MSARIYVLPRGLAKVSASRGSAQWRDHADEVLTRVRERLAAAVEAEAYHRDEMLAAKANAATYRQQLALLEEKIPSAQDAASTAPLGSPTRTEGDPRE